MTALDNAPAPRPSRPTAPVAAAPAPAGVPAKRAAAPAPAKGAAAANSAQQMRDTKGPQRGTLYPGNASGSHRAAVIGERARAIAPGFALALGVAAVATVVGEYVPLVGSAVPGAVIGAVVALTLKPGARLTPGLKWSSTFVLQCSVVLLGAQLSIAEAARVGVSSLPVMLGTLAVCLGAAWLYGRLLGVPRDLRTLIGVGTGICGGSAIAAVSPVIEAASTDVAYAISTIFLFNIAAVLAFPLLGHALGMSQQSFGLFAGTAVNDTSSVVATATTYGAAATSHAVVVKLVRTLMIIPICLGLAALTARRPRLASPGAATATAQPAAAPQAPAALAAPAENQVRLSPRRVLKLVPWFLIGFVLVAAVNSTGIIPSGAHDPLQHASVFLVAVALSAIGLSTNVAALRKAGPKPLLLGALLWITVATASLGLQALTGTL
jgi:uncharacterized integral membrane protein (TIGR00698 family)